MNAPDYKSSLAQAIEAQPRFVRCFPVNGFFKGPEKPILGVAIQVSRKAEDNTALIAAHKHVADLAKNAGDGAEGAKRDADLLGDAKLIEILYRVCREVDPTSIAAAPNDPSQWKPTQWGAFPGPSWMREHLTTDQLAALYNLIIEVRAKAAPDDGGIDHEAVEAVAKLCQEHAEDDIPEAVLAQFSRTKLTHLVVLLSVELASARLSVETLLKQIEAAEQAAQPEGASAAPDALVILEDHDETGVQWHLSFSGSNPGVEACVRCADRDEAVKLKSLIEQRDARFNAQAAQPVRAGAISDVMWVETAPTEEPAP